MESGNSRRGARITWRDEIFWYNGYKELVIGQKMVDPIRCRSDNKVPLIRSRINYVGAQLLLQFYWK